ncbi:MAG: polyphosphate kinase 1, partial [Actinomycetota bacterium]
MTLLQHFVSSVFRSRQDSYDSSIDTRYINRELSWLNFNERVLSLVADPEIPLLERCMFSAIFSSNLDEFFQIRVAALKDQVEAGVVERTPDGRTPQEQLDDIGVMVADLIGSQETLWVDVLKPELAANAIEIVTWDSLSSIDREHLVNEFESRIFPVLTPLAVDPAHPFPYISNLALNLAVVALDPRTDEHRFARVKLPQTFPRFMPLPVGSRFVLLEDVVAANLGRLFQGMTIEQCFTFRVTRNAGLSLDDEDAEDLLAAVEMELRRRRFGRAVRLEVPKNISPDVLNLMIDELELDKSDVTFHRSIVDMTGLSQLALLDKPKLRYQPWKPLTAGRLAAAEEAGRSIFSVIRERQLLVHHPHESFPSSVEAFVQEAADDINVLSIKMTLYRTSGDSSIARHLIKASELGKQVAVVLELQARFDEARNVSWAKELEYAGVHVTYGIVGLKTHAKCILVVRNDPDRMRRYVHVGTGNYNSVTARVYEDIGYFTCEESVGSDVAELFNYLTGYGQEPNYQSLFIAPHQLRPRIIDLIN